MSQVSCPRITLALSPGSYTLIMIFILVQTEKEIADLLSEIQSLENALAEKVPPMMVAHTRLENRTYRPNVELCRDPSQYGMVEEVAKITGSMQTLKDQLDVARLYLSYSLPGGSLIFVPCVAHRETLGVLERTLERITTDLGVKKKSLDLDAQCLQVRAKLSQHPKLL